MSRETDYAAMVATIDAVMATCAALRHQVVALAAADAVEPSADAMVRGRVFGLPDPTFRRLCRERKIPGARLIGKTYLAPRSAIKAWIEGCEQPKKPAVAPARETDDLDAILDRAARKLVAA